MTRLKIFHTFDEVKVTVVGLGYVGLPLSMLFSNRFITYGYDKNKNKLESLKRGISYIDDVKGYKLKEKLNKTFFPIESLRKTDFYIVAVPTPLNSNKNPDLNLLKKASYEISKHLSENQYVVIESTSYPGTTEDIVIPILESSGLKAGEDFGVAFSSERIDPGNKSWKLEEIPKIVGAIDEISLRNTMNLYKEVFKKVIPASDCRTVEATKMVENIFRNVNIALVNEFSQIFEKMNIDIWEVIDLASTKPFGFMPHYPGPGIGGHCIAVDPYFMAYKLKSIGTFSRFIELSREINDDMKIHVCNLIRKGLESMNIPIEHSNIAILGLSYKKNISDTRESPSITIIDEIISSGANIKVYDPYVKKIKTNSGIIYSETSFYDAIENSDCAVFLVDHDDFFGIEPTAMIEAMRNPVIVDCKNVFRSKDMKGFLYYGIGKKNNTANQLKILEKRI